jgi:hypothetical protein
MNGVKHHYYLHTLAGFQMAWQTSHLHAIFFKKKQTPHWSMIQSQQTLA